MRETHIPDVMITGMFISYRISRLIGHEHEEVEIYSIQYVVEDMDHLIRYQNEFGPELQSQHKARFGDQYDVFRTVMEMIEHNEVMK
jgi:hypothetical protein